LHRVRAGIPGVLGQLPTRLDLKFSEETGDEPRRCPPRLDTGESARETAEHLT
jgi:hypothetical protein